MRNIILLHFYLCFTTIIYSQTTTVNYTSSNLDMPNPERGFYFPTATSASNYTPLDAAFIASKRNYYTPYEANYMVHSTLVFRYFILDDFINSQITNAFLNNMQADFDAARMAGVKMIIRFSYTNTPPTGDCGTWICPPYGDATKTRILQHIGQIEPLLIANKDILATVQMGFIGVWGENYYTDHFGDASHPPWILTNMNWTDRSDVLNALLNAVPPDRTVQVRYPQMKQRYVYGLGAPTNSNPLALAEAYSQIDKARIGFHNDCFLESDTDSGTYNDYGPPTSGADTTNLKPYLAADSKYVPVGGETCGANNPNDNCASNGGRADSELSRFHYSFLNSDYNNAEVNNDWTSICLEDIKRNLGYRIELVDAIFPDLAESGNNMTIDINLRNVGYSAPFNPRGIELILRNTSTGQEFYAPLSDQDPRLWFTGSHWFSETLCLPPNIPSGNYKLFLNLPDPEPTLFDNPNYSIQLANTNIWEASSGYNDLNHIIQITNLGDEVLCYGEKMITSKSIYDPTYCEAILNLTGAINSDIYQVDDRILSDGEINSGNFAIFQARNEVVLNEGFEIEDGGIFWSIISECFD